MKTSNKILIALLITIFTVPLLLAYSLKSKMKKGEYTIVKRDNKRRDEHRRSGSFTAFKVVKVVAPRPGFLTCHINPSNAAMSYEYYNDQKDSIIVSNRNDTLYVTYLGAKDVTTEDGRRQDGELSIRLNLPPFNNLVVDGAVVVIDSLPASMSNLSISLSNRGVIKDGSKNSAKESAKVPAGKKEDVALQVAQTYGDERGRGDKPKMETLKNVSIEMLDLNMKDLLISCLLRRL